MANGISADRGHSIIKSFWKHDLHESQLKRYDQFLSFYKTELSKEQWSNPAQPRNHLTVIGIGRDVEIIASTLSENRGLGIVETQAKIHEVLPSSPSRSDEEVLILIDFVLRVWLTLNAREVPKRLPINHIPVCCWDKHGETLNEFVQRQFPISKWTIGPSESRLDKHFNVPYMLQACSLKIEWTGFICDHLRLNEENKTLQVYFLKLCAYDHLNGSGSSLGGKPILPKQMLLETIWTLNLLFPNGDQTTAFLTQENRTFHIDAVPVTRRPRDLNDYVYWRERLFLLRRLYMAEPENFREFWYKRQGYGTRFQVITTILFGFLLAVIFGVISSVTAIISTKATLKSLDVAREALELQKKVPVCPCS